MPAKKDQRIIRIICFGDVAGSFGRRALKNIIPCWQKKYQPDIFVANVENLAHHKGVTTKTLEEIRRAGISIMTGGNHIWAKEDVGDLANNSDFKLACPLNDSRTPKKYAYAQTEVAGKNLVVVSLQGQTFMPVDFTSNPFLAIDRLLPQLPPQSIVLIDMHAETTSEKRAMGFYLDGRVTAVVGTHTHVATADAQVLPQGTAYISDIGMTGPLDSVLGVKKEIIIQKFLTGEHLRHELPDSGQSEVNAVLLNIEWDSARAKSLEHLREIID